jgi:hypothetical protein
VRDHRADFDGKAIFANLLVDAGVDIVVVARDTVHRKGRVRCPRDRMAAAHVFDTGERVVVGDLQKEFPGHAPKPYSSFLIVPIYLGGKIVGAVSIDSSERYHFDFEADDLWVCLMPYINLLAWTLSPDRVKDAVA